ncbi:MAG: cell wall metabolism sensor histidine kinase WalK [Firmicutes bacterium]|nr:cell wall metabolism sensor histidine kinase WalK [Bacillota bacterium]HAL63808.1 PAS domain-containing sensor histidine kinase [Clostridiales bacterium]
MFKSIQTKIVTIFILVILSVVTVIGTFMTTNIVRLYNDEFSVMMEQVFTPALVSELEKSASSGGSNGVWDIVSSYIGPLGIDTYRFYSILDAETGDVLLTSDETKSADVEKSDNLILAMTGKVGNSVNTQKSYMDYALPIGDKYIVYVKDTKDEINSITQNVLFILVEALLFSVLISILLGYFFGRTITKPIRDLTKSTEHIAEGKFDIVSTIKSDDEIGILSDTFNYMSSALQHTVNEVNSEKNKVETILQNMTDGILAFNLSGRLIHINPEAKRLIGRTFYDDLQFDAFFKEVGADISMGNIIYIKDNKKNEREAVIGGRVIRFTFAPFNLENRISGIIVVVHDITNQQKLENARREFVANVSHELRTPLTTVKSYAETLMDMDIDDKEMQNHFLNTIAHEADRMTRIVKDLLTLSRLDEGQYQLKPFERVNLSHLVSEIVEKMFFAAKEKHQEITLSAKKTPIYAMTDRDKLEQVIINIISNAVKYTPENGKIEVSCEKVYKDAYIKVRDNGIGIPAENLPRIFERFYRVDNARSRETGGTGLGLAIAKQIMTQLGGNIIINSTYGEGTEVIVSVPL